MEGECIFCKIVAGEIPSHLVFEDDQTLAFMDINPIRHGHVVVIPKEHVMYVQQLEDELYQKVMLTVKKVMQAIDEVVHPLRVGVIVEGFDIDHAHVKVTPLIEVTDIKTHLEERVSNEHLAERAEKLQKAIT